MPFLVFHGGLVGFEQKRPSYLYKGGLKKILGDMSPQPPFFRNISLEHLLIPGMILQRKKLNEMLFLGHAEFILHFV